MKKILVSFGIFIILSLGITGVWALNEESFKLQLTIMNNSKNEDVDVYLLLPQEYIEFTIQKANFKIENYYGERGVLTYNGANTLKQNTIPGITVEKNKVQDDVYTENGIEYVQIKLEKNEEENYVFDILSDYDKMNMKYRIKNESKDYIVHIDNFKIQKGICKAEYDYDNDTIKQPDIKKMSFATIVLIIILVFVIILGVISYFYKGDRK